VGDQQNFGNITNYGGQQVFGSGNDVSQHNVHQYGDRRDDITPLLAELRRTAPDPAAAEPSIAAIEQALQHPAADSRGRIDRALTDLARNVGNARTALEAVAAIGVLVGAYLPL
jgi:hypothetical protein